MWISVLDPCIHCFHLVISLLLVVFCLLFPCTMAAFKSAIVHLTTLFVIVFIPSTILLCHVVLGQTFLLYGLFTCPVLCV